MSGAAVGTIIVALRRPLVRPLMPAAITTVIIPKERLRLLGLIRKNCHPHLRPITDA